MANVKLIFTGSFLSDTEECELQCFATDKEEILISIENKGSFHDYNLQRILLDRKTAIRFHRELKKQISYLESEVNNG